MLPPPGLITSRQKILPYGQGESVLVLCDDGRWHAGIIQAWHVDGRRRDVFLDYYASGHFGGWFQFSAAAIRMVPDDWWREPEKWTGEL